MHVVQEFTPSKSRYFLWSAGALTLGILMGLALSYVTFGYVSSGWLGAVLGIATLSVLRAVITFQNYTVVITDDNLSGPSVSGWKKLSVGLAQINKSQTGRRGLLEKIEGSRFVHSVNGERIVLSGLVYNQGQIRTMLEEIGCEVE
jgi:hypothetical protein